MKRRTKRTKTAGVSGVILQIAVVLIAGTLRAQTPPEGPTGADQVLTSIFDTRTNSIRVEGGTGSGGTVSSVGLSMPGEFAVTGSPVTSAGVLTVNWVQPASVAHGGTGQSTPAAAFNALAPATAVGGLIYGTGPNTYGNLALGTGGQCLESNGASLVWAACGSSGGFTAGGDLSGTASSQTVIGLQGRPLSALAPTSGQMLEWTGTAWTPSTLSGVGTVTSVGLALPSIFSVGGSPITGSGTLSAAFLTQGANTFLAGPSNGGPAVPGFRPLVGADLPPINLSLSGNGGVSGALSIVNGGTGQTTATAAFNALAPATATGGLIYGTGTNTYGNLALGTSGTCLGSTGTALNWMACGSGTGGSGTVNSGTQYQLGVYAATGPSISGSGAITTDASGDLTVADGIFQGGPYLSTEPAYLVMSSASAHPQIAFTLGSGSTIGYDYSFQDSLFGTRDVVHALGADSAAGYGVYESTSAAGLILNTTTSGAPLLFDVGGTRVGEFTSSGLSLNAPLGVASGGTGLSALGTAGQCLQVNGGATALQYGSCGAGGSGGFTNWVQSGTSGTVDAQPISTEDAPTVVFHPSLATGGTADIVDICGDTTAGVADCTNKKYGGWTFNGNFFMSGNSLVLGADNQADASYLELSGGTGAGAYVQLLSPALSTPVAPTVTNTAGSAIAAATYTFYVTYDNGSSNQYATPASSGGSTTCSGSGCASITVDAPTQIAGATAWTLYGVQSINGSIIKVGTYGFTNQTLTSWSNSTTGSLPTINTTGGANESFLSTSGSTSGLACISSTVPGADCPPGTTLVEQATGTVTTGDCAKWTGPNQIGDAGAACGSGAGANAIGNNPSTSQTITAGSASIEPLIVASAVQTTKTSSIFDVDGNSGSGPFTLFTVQPWGAFIYPWDDSTVPLTIFGKDSGQTADLLDVFNYQGGINEVRVEDDGTTILAHGLEVNANGSAVNLQLNSPTHIVSGSGDNDLAGSVTISAATNASITFAQHYNNPPACVLTPTSNPGTLTWWVTTTTTTVTANISASGTLTFDYHCMGNPN